MVQPGMLGTLCRRLATALETLPDLLVEVEAHGVAQRFDSCHQAAGRNAAGQGVGNGEGDAEVHDGEGQGLEHDAPR